MTPTPSDPMMTTLAAGASTLPTQRQLITRLLNAISNIPLDDEVKIEPAGNPTKSVKSAAAHHPLRQTPLACRPLLATLHVLFPKQLLQALDLLDHGLVTRVVLDRPVPVKTEQKAGEPVSGNAAAATADPRTPASPPPSFYTVAALPRYRPGRRHRDAPATEQVHMVHSDAWSCTCAAFAFDAFPGSAVAGEGDEVAAGAADGLAGEVGWEFGGLSLDGVGEGADGSGEGVPCCKHLLACVLARRWEAVLGSYVTVRRVSKQEMVGIMADV